MKAATMEPAVADERRAGPEAPAGRPRPLRNVASNWGAFVFVAIVNFVLSPFVVHSLGDAAYGTWVLVGSMVSYLGLLDLGVRGAVTRYVAQLHASMQHRDAGRIASAALALFATGGLLAIVASSGLAYFVDDVFQVPPALLDAARIVLIIGGFNVAISLISGVFGGVLTALQRFDLNGAVDVVAEALRAAAIVAALKLGGGLIGIAAVQLSVALLRGLIQYGLSRRIYPELRLTGRAWGRHELRLIFSFSVYSTFLQVAGMISLQASSLVIGAFLPVTMITAYAIAASLSMYARTLGGGVAQTLTPQASALEASGGKEAVRALPLIAARLSSIAILPIIITFIVRGGTFIGLWMGDEYAATGGAVLVVLSIGLWASAPRYSIAAIAMGIGRHRGLVLPYFAEALSGLAISIVLIRSMGVLGVAWGTTIPILAVSILFVPWFVQRVLDVRAKDMWLHAWVRPTVALIPFAVASLVVERTLTAEGILAFFLQVLLVLPVAFVGIWYVGLTGSERRRFAPRFARVARTPS